MPVLYSMTGFAQAQQTLQGCTVTMALRAVNHRFLDLRWQLSPEIEPAVADLEKQVRAALVRGHVEIRGRCDAPATGAAARLDPAAVETYLAAWSELQQRFGREEPPAIAEVLRAPGVLAAGSVTTVAPEIWSGLARAALAAALADLRRMRAVEGAALAADLAARLDALETARAALADLRLEVEAGLRERLELRLRDILGAAAPSPDRLLQEAALQADRSDISEELTRLGAHIAQARALLASGGEAGKKLDFLAQELNREVNTLLAKTTSASPAGLQVSAIGIGLKADLEKFREQVQNLE